MEKTVSQKAGGKAIYTLVESHPADTYHSFSSLDFLKYSFDIKITKLCP